MVKGNHSFIVEHEYFVLGIDQRDGRIRDNSAPFHHGGRYSTQFFGRGNYQNIVTGVLEQFLDLLQHRIGERAHKHVMRSIFVGLAPNPGPNLFSFLKLLHQQGQVFNCGFLNIDIKVSPIVFPVIQPCCDGSSRRESARAAGANDGRGKPVGENSQPCQAHAETLFIYSKLSQQSNARC